MKLQIERTDSSPLYEQIRNQIKQQILDGDLKPGQKLAAEREIMREYGLGYNTVTRALRELADEGFIKRTPRSGSFVLDRKTDNLTFGLLIPFLRFGTEIGDNAYIIPIINYVESYAKQNNASIILCNNNNSLQFEADNIRQLIDRKVDGIISYYIGGGINIECLKEIESANIPLVLIDRYVEGFDTNYVVTDNYQGAYDATMSLVRMGYDRIFHFTNDEDCTAVRHRIQGFRAAVKDAGLKFDSSCIKVLKHDIVGVGQSYQIMKEMIIGGVAPCAIFAVNPAAALGIMKAAEEFEINRSDIGVACFDESPLPIPEGFPFVNVLQPVEEMSVKSVQIILDKLAGKTGLQQYLLKPLNCPQNLHEDKSDSNLINTGIRIRR